MVIGREGEQDFLITDRNVSKRHCSITTTKEGVFRLKDLGSTNGTTKNGVEVIECDVTYSDSIVLGGTYKLPLEKIFPREVKAVFPERLRKVYNDYTEQKQKIRNAQRNKMNIRLLFTMVPGIISFVLGQSIDQQSLQIIGGICTAIGFIILLTALIGGDKSDKEMEDITDDFKLKYTCGNILKSGKKCGQFLGFDSPRIWENHGCTCPKCHQIII